MTKLIIFDFDGTLADTFQAVFNITNRLSEEFGYKSATKEELDRLRNLHSWQIIRRSGISVFKLPLLVRRVRCELYKEIQGVDLFSGIKEVLIELKDRGNRLGIVTSNSHENVLGVMTRNGLEGVFDFIYSGTTLFGKHKILNKLLKQETINPEEVIYVGDETRDIDAAKKAHVKVIAVGWGFHSKEALEQQNPDFLIERPEELIEVIKNWRSLQQ